MSDKFELILLAADLSAVLNALSKAGKISDDDVFNIEYANGINSETTVGKLLDHANERLRDSGFYSAFCEVQNG